MGGRRRPAPGQLLVPVGRKHRPTPEHPRVPVGGGHLPAANPRIPAAGRLRRQAVRHRADCRAARVGEDVRVGAMTRVAAGAGLVVGIALSLAAAPATAATTPPAGSAAPAPPPGTRPVDPDTECQGGGPDIVDLPPAQRRLAPEETWGVTRGDDVLVAIVGSGVDATHPQLVGQVRAESTWCSPAPSAMPTASGRAP